MQYSYEVLRSVRKTISVCVSHKNKITVRVPLHLSEKRIEEFLNSKKAWLEKVINSNLINLNANQDIIDYKSVYVCGKKLPLIISDRNEITPEGVYVKSVQKIKDTFIKKFSESFLALARNIAESMRITVNTFSVKSYKGKWGCCDAKHNISFNYILFMLPFEIQNYVIVHELVHTKHFNHSPEFWRSVQQVIPDYKKIRKSVKGYDFLINLYRAKTSKF